MTVVDDIKGRLDIVEVVSQQVALQRSGRSYKANCPFHQERTPSFHVFPDRQSWRCFGACATGGDVFSFVMRAENLEFAEALRQLAQQAGVALPDRERRSQQGVVLQVSEGARTYFQELLLSKAGTDARVYLERRGLSRDAIEAFELGLSPPDGESLKNHLGRAGYSIEQLAQAGLVHVNENGSARDLFRNRLMIPIRNGRGELGGFGGRALGDVTPKYLNSPRTALFDKGRLLYGLYLAKEEAGSKGLVVVEGYMDVIAAHQHGFKNVVASMGTALTQEQVAEIRRITADVTMALDPDAAGQAAMLRSLESSWNAIHSAVVGHSRGITTHQTVGSVEPKIAVLPSGLDPDQLIRNSPEAWVSLLENTTPIFDFVLKAKSNAVDISTPRGKAEVAQYIAPLIWRAEPTQQDQYLQKVTTQLSVTRDTLLAAIGRPSAVRRNTRPGTQSRGATPSPFAKLERDPLEDYCLALLLQHNGLGEAVEELRPEYFQRLENREIFSEWARQWDWERGGDQGATEVAALREGIDEELADHLETLIQKMLPPSDQHRRRLAFQDSVHRLEERYLRELKTEEGIRFAETPPDLAATSNQGVLEVNQRLKSNQSKRSSLVSDIRSRG